MESAATRESFEAAAHYFAEVVASIPVKDWERLRLGKWSLRDLVGHTARALQVIEVYLDAGATGVEILDAAAYIIRVLSPTTDHAAIAARGRHAGDMLGHDPASMVQMIVTRVVEKVAATPDGALVGTPAGGMTLVAYLPTRVFELAIHTLDLAEALGIIGALPESAALVTLDLVGVVAQRRGTATDLLLAATGRRALPPDYSVI